MRRLRSLLALLLMTAAFSCGQSITMVGHVTALSGAYGDLCPECTLGTKGVLTGELRSQSSVLLRKLSYTFVTDFGNTATLVIGQRMWSSARSVNQGPRLGYAVFDSYLTKPDGVFDGIAFGNVPVFEKTNPSAIGMLNAALRAVPVIWNETGAPISQLVPMQRGVTGGGTFQIDSYLLSVPRFSIQFSVDDLVIEKASTTALTPQNEQPVNPQSQPALPPTHIHSGPPSTAAIDAAISQTLDRTCSGLIRDVLVSPQALRLLTLYREDPALLGFEIERREVIIAGVIGCAAADLVVAMKGQEGAGPNRALQTGGNTISKNTADQLNKRFGKNLLPREWGRALEALKQDNGLPPNFHGAILANGDFVGDGNNYGSIADYLP